MTKFKSTPIKLRAAISQFKKDQGLIGPRKVQDDRLNKQFLWKVFNEFSDENYEINDDNREIIYTILRYFINDQDFNKFGIISSTPSLSKGILIHGPNGVGKSELFKVLGQCGKFLALNYQCRSLWFQSISSGSFIDEYMASTKRKTGFELEFYYKGYLYIDDLGLEKKAFNSQEIMGQLLFERNRIGSITFVTTNMKPSEIAQRYGDHIGDRLPEMFNIIKWDGPSRRE